jgi:ribonuclease VapC
MVVDTSILLAILFNEKHGLWCAEQLQKHLGDLRMSTVNLTEVMILIKDRQPQHFKKLSEEVLSSSIRFVPPTTEHAMIAAEARHNYPLNLGDCFAYALAKQEGCAVLTLDADFKKTDVQVISQK